MHISPPTPLVTVEAMNNTSFIILLQEICNTWNRMQYAVYLHAWRTQGASVVSVCVTGRAGGRKEENRGNKLAWLLTVHQPPAAIIPPAEGLDAEAGDGLRARLYT